MRAVIAGLVVLVGCGGSEPPSEKEVGMERRVVRGADGSGDLPGGMKTGENAEEVGLAPSDGVVDIAGELERLRRLEPGEQVEAIERVVLLLDPETYPLALEVMLSDGVTDEARGVLMADLFAHEDAGLRLPALVRVAQSAGDGALRGAALNHLVSELGQDYGSNWPSWMDAVERVLEGGGEGN